MATTKPRSKNVFLDLPIADPTCSAVDTEHGCWIKCGICDTFLNPKTNRPFNMIVPRKGGSFTIGRWNEHIKTDGHTSKLHVLKKADLEEKERNGTITAFELAQLNQQFRKKQRTLSFLPIVPSVVAATSSTNTPTTTPTTSIANQAVVPAISSTNTPTMTPFTSIGNSKPSASMLTKTCEGVIKAYRDVEVQKKIVAYVEFYAIDNSSGYICGCVQWNGLYQVFAMSCIVCEVKFQKAGKVWQCKECSELR